MRSQAGISLWYKGRTPTIFTDSLRLRLNSVITEPTMLQVWGPNRLNQKWTLKYSTKCNILFYLKYLEKLSYHWANRTDSPRLTLSAIFVHGGWSDTLWKAENALFPNMYCTPSVGKYLWAKNKKPCLGHSGPFYYEISYIGFWPDEILGSRPWNFGSEFQ